MDVRLDNSSQIVIDRVVPQAITVNTPVNAVKIDAQKSFGLSQGVTGPIPRGLSSLGWRFFQDQSSIEEPLYCPALVRTQIPNNGLGMLSTRFGVNSEGWLRLSDGRLYSDAIGDLFFFRINLTMNPSVNNKWVNLDFDQMTANRVWNKRFQLSQGAGNAVPDSFLAQIGCGPAMKQNGGAFYITPESDLLVSRVSIQAFKAFSLDPFS